MVLALFGLNLYCRWFYNKRKYIGYYWFFHYGRFEKLPIPKMRMMKILLANINLTAFLIASGLVNTFHVYLNLSKLSRALEIFKIYIAGTLYCIVLLIAWESTRRRSLPALDFQIWLIKCSSSLVIKKNNNKIYSYRMS